MKLMLRNKEDDISDEGEFEYYDQYEPKLFSAIRSEESSHDIEGLIAIPFSTLLHEYTMYLTKAEAKKLIEQISEELR